jgi:CheY-like chemotaxis protein
MSIPATILIVDDDVDFAAAARAVLEGLGYRVVSAEAAEGGLEIARKEKPGLILLDLMMEEVDSGVRLAHQLRRDPDTSGIPIVILTGVRMATGFEFAPVTPQDYEWIRADAWVEKPVRPRQLAELAARLLPAIAAQREKPA